ncbi:MAG: hypothetical protein M1833_001769 [Piccolia ochrophora]|nr:MAG: hypothetical protein M1833_001769 [Piccolia ochrophora]
MVSLRVLGVISKQSNETIEDKQFGLVKCPGYKPLWSSAPNIDDLDLDDDYGIGGDLDNDYEASTLEDEDDIALELRRDDDLASLPDDSNLLDEKKTATINDTARVLSSASELTSILARAGVDGPRYMKAVNLQARAVKIGDGSQFTVFKDRPGGVFRADATQRIEDPAGLVYKRVNIPFSAQDGGNFSQGLDYRMRLRTLELEILALCHPRIRGHRNVVSLIAWGYDYPYPNTPVPVLMLEAALMTLTDFVKPENASLLDDRAWDVRHHLALDVASGLQLLHRFHIVHGDVKPDNVLIFRQSHPDVPFVAKLSDFGVCVDLQDARESALTSEDYQGTDEWLGPDARDYDDSKYGPFDSSVMFRFDAYSYGLILLAVFLTAGEAPRLNKYQEDFPSEAEAAIYLLRENEHIPSTLRTQLVKATRQLLAALPASRSLPSPALLETSTSSYAEWMVANEISNPSAGGRGTKDHLFNRGPAYWHKLDNIAMNELESQYKEAQCGKVPDFPGETLFGMAQALKRRDPDYEVKLVDYLTAAGKAGFVPAQAIYGQIINGRGLKPRVDPSTVADWALNGVAQGYVFSGRSSNVGSQAMDKAKQTFRDNGGYCIDAFLDQREILALCRRQKMLEDWSQKHDVQSKIDFEGNTILHAAAALGCLDSVQRLIHMGALIDGKNANRETALYKACQAGHSNVTRHLIEQGAEILVVSRRESLTPLHWLFVFPPNEIRNIALLLVGNGKTSVNAKMVPEKVNTSIDFARSVPLKHFPFELPFGTPLHWASFARNVTAIETLLDLGADVNATYDHADNITTPLALAVHFGELQVIECLLSRGANPKILDIKGRNLLHLMSYYRPQWHGSAPHIWHNWIRHGRWDNYRPKIARMVRLLVDAGVDIEARDDVYPKLTPVVMAAQALQVNGALISALIDSGADIIEARGGSGDTVLHSWLSDGTGALDYPESFTTVLSQITKIMGSIEVVNKYAELTPLHALVSAEASSTQYADACRILFERDPPADVNAKDRQGDTPILRALSHKTQATFRASILLEAGADLLATDDRDSDFLSKITFNDGLSDGESFHLIQTYLAHISPDRNIAFSHFKNTHTKALWNASAFARLKTLSLLLDLSNAASINTLDTTHQSRSALDWALNHAELSRQAHIIACGTRKPGAPLEHARAQKLLYDEGSQGPPTRAEEAYFAFPKVIALLLSKGAKRACDFVEDPENISQPGEFDFYDIYRYRITPDTQPFRDMWQPLYDLARYPEAWMENTILSTMREQYENGEFTPVVEAIKGSKEVASALEEMSIAKGEGGWAKAVKVGRVGTQWENIRVKIEGGVVTEEEIQLEP